MGAFMPSLIIKIFCRLNVWRGAREPSVALWNGLLTLARMWRRVASWVCASFPVRTERNRPIPAGSNAAAAVLSSGANPRARRLTVTSPNWASWTTPSAAGDCGTTRKRNGSETSRTWMCIARENDESSKSAHFPAQTGTRSKGPTASPASATSRAFSSPTCKGSPPANDECERFVNTFLFALLQLPRVHFQTATFTKQKIC